mgnify:CR=1 FL=1
MKNTPKILSSLFALLFTSSVTAASPTRAEGEKFLKENAGKKGVVTTKSGLQYIEVKKGTGKVHPKPTDVVRVDYEGTLINGTVFDGTKGRKPAEFPLNRVIPGWTEGLQLMTEGAEYKFFIPSNLAYGENQVSNEIVPGSTLIFTVTLHKILGPS